MNTENTPIWAELAGLPNNASVRDLQGLLSDERMDPTAPLGAVLLALGTTPRQEGRAYFAQLLFELIDQGEIHTKRQLVREVGLSETDVTGILNTMVENGMINVDGETWNRVWYTGDVAPEPPKAAPVERKPRGPRKPREKVEYAPHPKLKDMILTMVPTLSEGTPTRHDVEMAVLRSSEDFSQNAIRKALGFMIENGELNTTGAHRGLRVSIPTVDTVDTGV